MNFQLKKYLNEICEKKNDADVEEKEDVLISVRAERRVARIVSKENIRDSIVKLRS